jgi:UDP-3-O-[3-hydroxymyristoyl] glucosamine N-acyltransferase
MEFSAAQIAQLVDGQVQGDEQAVVSGLSKIEEGQPSTLTFLANMKYEEFIYETGASIAIVNTDFEPRKALPKSLTLIKVPDAYACFAKLLEHYNQMNKKQPEISDRAIISANAKIGEQVYIGANAFIDDGAIIGEGAVVYPNAYIGENVKIGKYTTIHPNVSIYHNCEIGANCIIHAGAVIGADGFGFAPDENGKFSKVPQIGNVLLEDDVEIGANATIDRATMGSTILRKGVKIDNLVQIAHNVEIGKNSAMAAQVGIAGSTKIGERVWAGGQAGISGHIKIADDTKIVSQSGIAGSVKKPGQTLMGAPAYDMQEYKKSYFGFRKLPYILNKLRELEDKITNKQAD